MNVMEFTFKMNTQSNMVASAKGLLLITIRTYSMDQLAQTKIKQTHFHTYNNEYLLKNNTKAPIVTVFVYVSKYSCQ